MSTSVVAADADLQAKLEEARAKHDVPALAAALVSSEGLVAADCVGNRKRGTNDKLALSDRLAIGSCTKSMTATLAAVMVESGKIQWTTTIGDVWPLATDEHIHPKLKTVTLDQLLSHQSGLPSDIDGQPWLSFFDEKSSPTLERRRMLRLVLSKPPAHPQGKFSYSNLGYVIVAAMLETQAGEAYESLMKKHIFAPLQMQSADFRSMATARQMKPPLVWGHHQDGSLVDPRTVGAENPTVYASCGTVHLTIEDFARYARWHVSGDPAPVLSTKAAYEHLHQPQVDHTSRGGKYGSGWVFAQTPLGRGFNHAGSNTNSFALIWVFPDSGLAAVACTNTDNPQAFTACDEIIAHLVSTHATKGGKVTPERLVGRYQLAPNFIFDVKLQNGKMMVGITNQPTQQVYEDSPTKWSYRSVDATLEFHLRSKGPAYALTLHQNGLAQRANRIRN